MVPGLNSTTDATRKMTLMQMEAIAMNEKMSGGFNMAGASIGRLRQSLASGIAMMSGISPIAARIASTMGVMATGIGEVVLGMAAIGTVIWVYDKLTESIRKAADEQDKLVLKLNAALRRQMALLRETLDSPNLRPLLQGGAPNREMLLKPLVKELLETIRRAKLPVKISLKALEDLPDPNPCDQGPTLASPPTLPALPGENTLVYWRALAVRREIIIS